MRKYSFLVHHAFFEGFVEELKELGVLHIIETDKEVPLLMQDEYRQVNEIDKTLKFLVSLPKELALHEIEMPADGAAMLDLVKGIQLEQEQIGHQLNHLEKEKKQLQPWGVFSWDVIENLKSNGIDIRFFTCSARKYNPEWENEFNLFPIAQVGSLIYFALLLSAEETLPDWEADESRLPVVSLPDVEAKIIELLRKTDELNGALRFISAQGTSVLENYSALLKDKLSSGMAQLHSLQQVDGNVVVLEGWVPDTAVAELEAAMDRRGTLYLSEKWRDGDKPPVLLKNNRFTRLFEVIGNLYSLPNYGELDLTPYLAPFYLLFFGFCFSDAGYGLLFVIGATIAKFKSDKPNPILTLVQLLGASTILFGLLGGTFFGIELYKTNLPIYSTLGEMLKESGITVQDIMFKASLGLGLIQILFGMFIRAAKLIKQQGLIYAVSTLSWAFLIIASALNYWLSTKGVVDLWNPVFITFGSLCLVGIFFMNMPGKNLLLNFGAGLWDAYNTVVGGIGDLLSYVRLFALGLASGILGLVFNDLGSKLLTSEADLLSQILGYVAMTLVLIVGHGINIFMSGLGSMVHPLRLTFVEFYKNAGFEGGGKPYNPIKKQTI